MDWVGANNTRLTGKEEKKEKKRERGKGKVKLGCVSKVTRLGRYIRVIFIRSIHR
jgi:hypothetical protein